MIRIDDEQYWLYAAVDPDSDGVPHIKFETTRTNALAEIFVGELREEHVIDDAVFLLNDATPLKEACRRYGLDFRYERHRNRNSVERVVREVERCTDSFSNRFSYADPATADDWLRSFAFAWNQLI